jgi:DNA mismatch endonuclease (patch repair protein)
MSRIRGKDTTPEKAVRSLLRRLGFRLRLNVKIPVSKTKVGTARRAVRTPQRGVPTMFIRPDIVLVKHRLAVFVHGCFWHRHRGCRNCTTPTHRRAWWVKKLEGNAARDKLHQRALRKLGWKLVVVWECETENPDRLERTIANRLLKIGPKASSQ